LTELVSKNARTEEQINFKIIMNNETRSQSCLPVAWIICITLIDLDFRINHCYSIFSTEILPYYLGILVIIVFHHFLDFVVRKLAIFRALPCFSEAGIVR